MLGAGVLHRLLTVTPSTDALKHRQRQAMIHEERSRRAPLQSFHRLPPTGAMFSKAGEIREQENDASTRMRALAEL